MALSVLRTVARCTRNANLFANLKNPKLDRPSANLIHSCKCIAPMTDVTKRHRSNLRATDSVANIKDRNTYKSSESESDSDLEPLGRRGESDFWRRKIRTFHRILDVNRDGVISYDDFLLLAERFIELGHLTDKHTTEFRTLMTNLWEKRWGPVNPYNLVTVEQFLEDMHHVINDKHLVRRAHSFLPYLFRALDKDGSGAITEDEFRLFFRCLGLNEEDATLAFRCIDEDGDGLLVMKEFVKYGREFFLTEDEEKVSKYFFGPLMDH